MGATAPIEASWGLALPPVFDGCVLPELSLDGRLMYSTGTCECEGAAARRGAGSPRRRPCGPPVYF